MVLVQGNYEPKDVTVPKEKQKKKEGLSSLPKEVLYSVWEGINKAFVGQMPTEEEMTAINNWVLNESGRYLFQKLPWATVGAYYDSEGGVPDLPDMFEEDWYLDLKVPKIPANIYTQIISFFRSIMGKMGQAEAFCQVYWDVEEEEYIINVPKQKVSVTRVEYDREKDFHVINPKRYYFVFECHSHNNMGAFWSGTDNADEQASRLYGVFGKLGQQKHAELFRLVVNGAQHDIPMTNIFDLSTEITVDGHDPKWEENVEVLRVATRVTTTPITRRGSYQEDADGNTYRFPSNRTLQDYEDYDAWIADEDHTPTHFEEAEMDESLDRLMDITNAFECMSTTLMMLEGLEYRGSIHALRDAVNAYLGEEESDYTSMQRDFSHL